MKRINFTKISIKNFLSIGDEPVVIKFKDGMNIITGVNKDEEDIKNGLNWYKENSEQLDALTKKAFAELGEVFWSLWD